MVSKVLITGGSGFIGTRLTTLLLSKGFKVEHIGRSRNSKTGVKTWLWNVSKNELEPGCFLELTNKQFVIIHLAGEGIADKKWTPERKKSIVESRTKTIEFLLEKCKEQNCMPAQVISAGGSGFYGMITSDRIFTETDSAGQDFLAECCIAWENAVKKFTPYSKVTILRTPMVLDKNEGALAKMAQPVKFGMPFAYSSGQQWISWVHIDDLVKAYLFCLENNLEGIYNVAAPGHVSNRAFMKVLAKQMKVPFLWPPMPEFALKTLLGEMSGLVTKGSRINGNALIDKGFDYQFKVLPGAIENIYS